MENIYIHNWYNRNNSTWVYGPSVSLNSTYSNLRYTAAEASKLLHDYKLLAKEIGETLYNYFGLKVIVKISKDAETSFTDGKKICVKDIDCPNDFEHLDVLFAFAFHEAAHCLYTNWKKLDEKHIYKRPLLSHIQNILEDEEIENRMAKHNISFSKYFARLKYNLFETSCGINELKKNKINRLDEIMTILFCVIRYPKYINYIDNSILNKYSDLFIKINNILINCNCPAASPFMPCKMYDEDFYNKQNVTDTTVNATFEIYKYLQEFLAEDFNDEQKEVEENEESSINSMGNGMPGDIIGMGADKINEMINGEDWGEDNCYIPHDDIWSGSDKPDTDLNTNGDRVRFGNSAKYNSMLEKMRPYMKIVENAVIPNDVKMQDALEIHRFRRNGNLDTTRLAEAMQNINTIYNQRMTVKKPVGKAEPKYAFVMIIDESGSMETYDRADEFAHSVAILFNEVFAKFKGIEFYVYGHGDKINPYITKEMRDKFVLGNYDKQGGQDDAQSYKWIINDVKRQTNLPIIALSVTDFYYCSADNDMRELFNDMKIDNVSFNMLKLSGKSSPRDIAMCERVLKGQVVSIKNVKNHDEILDGLNDICDIIKTNYKRFCKK